MNLNRWKNENYFFFDFLLNIECETFAGAAPPLPKKQDKKTEIQRKNAKKNTIILKNPREMNSRVSLSNRSDILHLDPSALQLRNQNTNERL